MQRSEVKIWRPYTQERLAPPPIILERAHGPYLYSRDGQEILDAISSWWVITHGHCQPEIVEAVREQAGRLDQVLFANFSHPAAEELAEELLGVADPSFSKVFLSDNGSTAVEVALKMALQACQQSGAPERNTFLAFARAYHGDTVGAMSVSARGSFTAPYERLNFRVLRAAQPTLSSAPIEDWLSDFKRLLSENQPSLAGVILEPLVQGAAGMIMWPTAAVKEIARLTKKSGAYLIFDEVMTGFGRTGSLFAYEQVGIAPDFLCLSKGITGGFLPLGATLTTREVFAHFYSPNKSQLFFHGHSFTGNPLSCAAALANLRLVRTGTMSTQIKAIEATHRSHLARLKGHPKILDPRVCGTIAALEIHSEDSGYNSQAAAQLGAYALERGVFLRPLGNTIYLMPPYSCSPSDLDLLWQTVEGFCALA